MPLSFRPVSRPLLTALAVLLALTLLGFAIAPAAATGCTPGLQELDLPDGGHYCGQVRHGKLQGQGRIDWNNGQTYEGQFAHGFMEGQGHLLARQYEYNGQFRHGSMNGQGTLARGKGWVYQGAFVNDEMQGQGKLTVNGYVYEGQFQHDKPDGKGVLRNDEGGMIEGQFDGFTPVGPAIVRWPSGDRYEGPLRGNRPHGEGAWTRPDKAVVRGTFEYGELDGNGSIQYPDGARYTGAIGEQRQAEGKGELRRPNGDVYTGNFADDQFDGPGTLTHADGSAQTGYWRAGQYTGTQGDGTLEDTPEVAQRNAEAVLYNQQALLQRQWDQLQPSGPGAPRMYALFVAGDGSQEVFRREVAYVDALFARRFDTRGRSVSLVNSRSSTSQLPLATAHSIELALQALARNMNRERDLLFVFLTSHGSRAHELSLGLKGLALPDLPAGQLADMLKASGIRNQIVVVSACYSGGFVPLLQGEHTWVITAARADRTSFGCADDNDFTYFGRALFKEALPTAPTLSAAFTQADQLVAEWENGDAGKSRPSLGAALVSTFIGNAARGALAQHSEPQSAVSPAFRAEVDAWFQSHPAASGAK